MPAGLSLQIGFLAWMQVKPLFQKLKKTHQQTVNYIYIYVCFLLRCLL